MTLLIVDDEARIRDLIRKYAAFEGYNVEEASNGMEAIEKCRQKNYDLIIMDVMMPELDGFSACREIRRKSQVPVIMLSARGEEYDRIHGFELGIDDYVVKPFSPRELMMRVSAVLKRTAANVPAASDGERVTIGDMVVDFAARQVTIKGEKLNLSPKEYDLLFYMVRNRGIALTREKLISDVWGYDSGPLDGALIVMQMLAEGFIAVQFIIGHRQVCIAYPDIGAFHPASTFIIAGALG